MSATYTLKTIPVGPLAVNCYILMCNETKKTVVIDPGEEGKKILSIVKEMNGIVSYILNTHGHFDHIGGNAYLAENTNGKLAIHSKDKELLPLANQFASVYDLTTTPSPKPDVILNDGDELKIGKLLIKVIHTPGHTPGGVCLLVEDLLFSGDTLFRDSMGRTDLPGGNLNELINSIKNKLFKLDKKLKVLPGHHEPTTIGREEKSNPFLNRTY